MIRKIKLADIAAVSRIYNYYILNSISTFEEVPVTQEEMQRRVEKIIPRYPFLVWEDDETIYGYAFATEWKPRSSYRFTVETSVYVDHEKHGSGIGGELYAELLYELSQAGYKVALGGIALPNEASVVLHEKLGFRKKGHLEKVGYKFGQWIDVGYWQKELW
jgi:L-amino acid N-acyltransferase YncA